MARRTRHASKRKTTKEVERARPEVASRARGKRGRKRGIDKVKTPGIGAMDRKAIMAQIALIRSGAAPMRRPSFERTPEEKVQAQVKFLATLRETGNVRCSCEVAGIERNTAYSWRMEDDTFRELWREALESAIDLLEQEAWRRGYDGVDKPIVYKGRVMTTYKEYSDRMLEILLKAHRKKFRDKHELTGEDGGPILLKRVERVIVDPKDKK